MDIYFHQDRIPFLTLEGAEEVETLEIAAHYSARDCMPQYPGRIALAHVLPDPLAYVQDRIERRVARRHGETSYKKLKWDAYSESLNHSDMPDAQRMVLIEHSAETAARALGNLAARDNDEIIEDWGTHVLDDPVSKAAELHARIEDAYSAHDLTLDPVQPRDRDGTYAAYPRKMNLKKMRRDLNRIKESKR